MSKLVFKSKSEKNDAPRQLCFPDYIFDQVKKVFQNNPKVLDSINMILPNKKGDFQIFLPRSVHVKSMFDVLEIIELFLEEYEIFVV